MNYHGIIYDLDGTLNLSNYYYSVYEKYFLSLLSDLSDQSPEHIEELFKKHNTKTN